MATDYDPNRRAFALYVGDLHPLITEGNIKAFFNKVGEVVSVKLCRDMNQKKSLGYAYVNFRTHQQAQNAFENLNYELLLNRPVRIMWANRDPNVRNSGKYNMYVKNLEPSVTQRQFFDSCGLFGKVLSAKLATDSSGKSKCYGFVHFADEIGYNRALEFLHGYTADGKRYIYAGPFIPKYERESRHDPNKFNNCFVKNFGEALDDDKLRQMFEPYGKITSALVMKDEAGKSRGFGFVCFESCDDAKKACETLNNTDVEGNSIYVGKAIKKEERSKEVQEKQEKIKEERKSKYTKCVNIYIKNLDISFTDEDLHNAFSKYGEIASAKIMRKENGVSRGFGFVCFKEGSDAARAISEMKNQMINNKPLYVAIAQRREERAQKMHEIFCSKHDELNNPGFNYFNPILRQGVYGSNMIQRRNMGPMNQAMAMNTSSYIGNPPNMNHFNFIRATNRIPMAGGPNMSQPMVAQGARPVNTRAGFNNNPQMNTRLLSMSNPIKMSSGNVQYNHTARNVNNGPSIQPDEKKQRFGNKLMPIVNSYYPEEASRITGVLLSMDLAVLEKIMEDQTQLKARIDSTRERILNRDAQAKKTEGN